MCRNKSQTVNVAKSKDMGVQKHSQSSQIVKVAKPRKRNYGSRGI